MQQSDPPRQIGKPSRSHVWFIAALLIFLSSTVIAYRQQPWPDPIRRVPFLSLDWWWYPYERNALARLPIISTDVYDVFVVPETNTVWAVGRGGLIAFSEDNGRTWTHRKVEIEAQTPAESGGGNYEAGSGGGDYGSKGRDEYPNDPKQEQQKAPEVGAFLDRLFVVVPASAIAGEPPEPPLVQDQSLPGKEEKKLPAQTNIVDAPIRPMKEAPVPPRQAPPLERRTLRAVYFVDANRGWIVGDAGTILHTADGGERWTLQESKSNVSLRDVYLTLNGQRGWVVGSETTILETRDGGENWQPYDPNRPTRGYLTVDLTAIAFAADGQHGWIVGDTNTTLVTNNGGDSWERQSILLKTRARLTSVYALADGRQTWLVDSQGGIFSTITGKGEWGLQQSGIRQYLTDVHFAEEGVRGWVVGQQGMILYTADRGRTWTPQTSDTAKHLHAVSFAADEQHGWVVGDRGTIITTADGGATWTPQTRGADADTSAQSLGTYSIWPGPWYYLIGWTLPLVFLFFALRSREAAVPVQESIADRLVSDRPLQAGDPDPLSFNTVARGLSRFLRNKKTQPPLTIAITGEWGTGKSSLMNLLRADLEQYGFRPVWFNAWHHQKEEQLLAALLESVHAQGIPQWWRPEGWRFRAQLLWTRGWQRWLPVLAVLFVLAVSIGYVVAHPQSPHEALEQLRAIVDGVIQWVQGQSQPSTRNAASDPVSSAASGVVLTTLLTSVGLFLRSIWKGLTAFGVSPANLLASVSGSTRVRDLQAQTGFRRQFAAEFRDVTQALAPRTMPILIDDLDRCRPEKVLEVLEAINFLVASGDCFVVMGMALERVERCVGLGFKDAAEELVDADIGSDQPGLVPRAGQKKRAAFARQYLEKLINIEVPVPEPTPVQISALVSPEQPRAIRRWERIREQATVIARQTRPGLALALVLFGGFWFGMRQEVSEGQHTIGQGMEEAHSVIASQPQQTQLAAERETALSYAAEDQDEQTSDQPAQVIAGQAADLSRSQALIFSLVLLAVGGWILVHPLDVVVRDSPEFEDALRIWLPVMRVKQNTPRAVKRFLNRVRYLAMRQRPPHQPDTVWRRLQSWLTRTVGQTSPATEPTLEQEMLPEHALVALSSVFQTYAEQATNGDDFHRLVHEAAKEESIFRRETLTGSASSQAILQQALQAHEERFGDWPAMDSYWTTFRKIAGGVRVS